MAKQIPLCRRLSKLFQPANSIPLGAEVKNNDMMSKSHKLMLDAGMVAPSKHGFFYLLPLATRSLDKLARLVDKFMSEIGAQKISCPTLTSSALWEKTDRLALTGPELFHLKDRHGKNFILSPTHEESVTQLLASMQPLSYKHLPLLLYQMTAKFRDEMKPRFGLIRSREFLMKDLYSFDTTGETARQTYNTVTQAYQRLFQTIGVDFVKVQGSTGMMGGQESHEFHFPATVGDDTLRLCAACRHAWNQDSCEQETCPQCGSHDLTETKGIEVGHTFLLDTRYSVPLQAVYSSVEGQQPLVMGSYGLGLTRILAASLEMLSLPDKLHWPPALAPYSIVIITPKEGSKESERTEQLSEELYWSLQQIPGMENDVIVDDRSQLTIGKRVKDAQRTGYPLVVVVGKMAASPSRQLELLDTCTGQTTLLGQPDLMSTVSKISTNEQWSQNVRVAQ